MATDWAGTAAAYDSSFARLCQGAVPAIVKAARGAVTRVKGTTGSEARTAIDVGTGTGTVAAALAAEGLATIGVDADEGMVAFASGAHPELTFTVGALPSLPFRAGEFDLVIANFVVNHTLEPRAAARELARIATAGGIVIATIWPSEPLSAHNTLWREVVHEANAIPLTGARLPARRLRAQHPRLRRTALRRWARGRADR